MASSRRQRGAKQSRRMSNCGIQPGEPQCRGRLGAQAPIPLGSSAKHCDCLRIQSTFAGWISHRALDPSSGFARPEWHCRCCCCCCCPPYNQPGVRQQRQQRLGARHCFCSGHSGRPLVGADESHLGAPKTDNNLQRFSSRESRWLVRLRQRCQASERAKRSGRFFELSLSRCDQYSREPERACSSTERSCELPL